MTAYINTCNLKICNMPPRPVSYDKSLSNERISMKIFTSVFVLITIYDLTISSTAYGDTNEKHLNKFINALIPDLISLVSMFIFYVMIPMKNIFFTGISFIPMYILVIVEIEFSLYNYEYEEIGSLYFLLIIVFP